MANDRARVISHVNDTPMTVKAYKDLSLWLVEAKAKHNDFVVKAHAGYVSATEKYTGKHKGQFNTKTNAGTLNTVTKRNPKKKRTKFKHKHIRSASSMAKGSIRTVKRGKVQVRVGCPKGAFSRRTKKCAVGTRAVSILKPNPKGYRVFLRSKNRTGYWTGSNFDTVFNKSANLDKADAVALARKMHRKYPNHTFGVSLGRA